MKTQGFEARFSQNLAPVSLVKPQNLYLAYISHLFLDFPRINILAMAKSLTEPEFKPYNTNELLDTKS